jgi:hypothetical protein
MHTVTVLLVTKYLKNKINMKWNYINDEQGSGSGVSHIYLERSGSKNFKPGIQNHILENPT